MPLENLYFCHYLLTDNKTHKFWKKLTPFSWIDPNSFTKPLLWVNYDNSCLIEEISPFNYHIFNDFIDLNLCSTKKPLLVCGKGIIDLKVKKSYYYSLSRLATSGQIKVRGKWLQVEGLSWHDHQWANTVISKADKWTWFSIQLDNDLDIICFVYGDKIKTFHATSLDKNNQLKVTDKVIFRAKGDKFKSQETGAKYQLGYEIYFPDWNLALAVKPLNKNQEMVAGPLNYWEGGIKVEGVLKDKKVYGLGFLEIVGEPMKKNVLGIYLKRFEKEIWQNFKSISKIV